MSIISRPRILCVLSSSPQGFYLPEFAHPHEVLAPHCDLIVASPLGGPTVLDPVSVELFKNDEYCVKFAKQESKLWLETRKLEDFLGRAKEFDAIFVVGGFGPMFDLVENATSTALINEFYASNLLVSAVCHGSAALLNVRLPNGHLLIHGHRVTGFSNAEEIAVDRQKDMPFHLETALDEASGGGYEKAVKAWDPWVVVSEIEGKRLLTGQNPGSARGLAEEVLKALLK